MTEKVNDRIDELEAIMLQIFEPVDCPVKHRFVPGMYIREIFMKRGLTITSMIHKTIHPFFILKGRVKVYCETEGVKTLQAPHTGITYPGTRRVLKIEKDCIWVTVHKTDIKPKDDSPDAIEEAVSLICAEIIEQRENELLGGVLRNNVVMPRLGQEEKVLTDN